jgi:hypothetical protein
MFRLVMWLPMLVPAFPDLLNTDSEYIFTATSKIETRKIYLGSAQDLINVGVCFVDTGYTNDAHTGTRDPILPHFP